MIKCFIQVVNGESQNHPVIASNFKAVFPNYDIDAGELPENWVEFSRIDPPVLGPYDLEKSSEYGQVDGVWTDVWTITSMTEDEKLAKQAETKAWWADNGYASWTFDEDLCRFVPPVPRPVSGLHVWDEPTTSWVEVD